MLDQTEERNLCVRSTRYLDNTEEADILTLTEHLQEKNVSIYLTFYTLVNVCLLWKKRMKRKQDLFLNSKRVFK